MICPGYLGDWRTNLGAQAMVPKKHQKKVFFQLNFNIKYVEVAINDFTIHLIISKWLRRQKYREKRKIIRQKEFAAEEEIVDKSVFIHLNT